ncbi:MAG: HAMP domain-containing protein, partial [Planctomycetota bacterium]
MGRRFASATESRTTPDCASSRCGRILIKPASDATREVDLEAADVPARPFAQRRALLLVGISPVIANLIGSAFNISYNVVQIDPLLSELQRARFADCWKLFNVLIYPLAVTCWIVPLVWLLPTHRALLAGRHVEPELVLRAQRCVINLPWWILAVAGIGWLICIPVFPLALSSLPEPLDTNVVLHLITSFLIGALIAVTQSFFAVEIVSQRCLFPVFFRRENPAEVPGAIPLSITARGLLWTMAAVVSPVISLELLIIVPAASQQSPLLFGLAVGAVAIAFGTSTSWMLGKLIADPVQRLTKAAIRVSEGDLDVSVHLLKADEFGLLTKSFNQMVEGLRQRERLQETFGRHVGQEAAREIMNQGDGLVGSERNITVMFVDVRNFTAHSAKHSPEEVVSALNIFFRDAVEKVEAQGGMVNKFLGDGFMALFG